MEMNYFTKKRYFIAGGVLGRSGQNQENNFESASSWP